MNNLTFGNDTYQYYETICSGSPAGVMNSGEGFDGTDAVHTHMTNSRLTDPEVLEMRFPVLLEDFHIRAMASGSGGGQWSAGSGTMRTIRFLETMDCAILSSHRTVRPHGLFGGEPGELGATFVRRKDGRVEELRGRRPDGARSRRGGDRQDADRRRIRQATLARAQFGSFARIDNISVAPRFRNLPGASPSGTQMPELAS